MKVSVEIEEESCQALVEDIMDILRDSCSKLELTKALRELLDDQDNEI